MNLPPNYIAGLVDGEGCFSLRYHAEVKHHLKGKPIYPRWKAEFAIVMREDDTQLLRMVQDGIGCGTITKSQGAVRYSVQGTKELINVIIPFFNKYPLHGKKATDFKLWCEAVTIIDGRRLQGMNIGKGIKGFAKKVWSTGELDRLQELHQKMVDHKTNRVIMV